MELFTWNNEYSVHNKELDNHHKRLFYVFNKLYKSCLDKNVTFNLSPIIEELVSYIKYHFDAEELYMKSIEFKDVNVHISEHRFFTSRIVKYHNNKNMNDSVASKEIVLYLWKWLMDHIMIEDKKYSTILKKEPCKY